MADEPSGQINPEQADTKPAEDTVAQTSWLDGLSDDLKGNEALKGFASVEDAAKAYLDLKGKLPVVPEKPDAYSIEVPEGLKADEALMGEFRNAAHEAKLTVDQAKTLTGWWNKRAEAEQKAVNDARTAWTTELQTDWGGKFEGNVAVAQKAIRTLAPAEFVTFLEQSGLGNHPAMVRMFHRIGEAVSEDKLVQGTASQPAKTINRMAGIPMLNYKENAT